MRDYTKKSNYYRSYTGKDKVSGMFLISKEDDYRRFKKLKKEKALIVTPEIPGYAFSDYKHLKKVIISDSVIRIGGCAFYNCRNLDDITKPDSVKEIGFAAFFRY